MYRAGRPPGAAADYHTETISSRAAGPAAHGSGREASVRCTDVVPTGYGRSVRAGTARAAARPGRPAFPCRPSSPAALTFPKRPGQRAPI
jgi:hypothetical protein